MRWLLAVLALLPLAATAQPRIVSGSGTYATGPRILGEPAFAFQLDALEQAEATRPGWPVTTTRASTRMCWTGSAWQTVPENTPCIGRYGLASFGAGTNYWPNSSAVGAWALRGTPVSLGDDMWADDDPAALEGWQVASIARTAGEAWTLTCEMRAGTLSSAHLFADGSTAGCLITGLTAEWTRRSCTNTSPTTSSQSAVVYIGNTTPATTGSIGIRQCQLEKSPTPGPRHDCGGSACSWQADVHTVSTAGWPVEKGEVRLQYTPLNSSPASIHLLDIRSGSGAGFRLYFNASGAIVFNTTDGATQGACGRSGLTWLGGQTYSLRAVWGAGSITVYRDDESICTANSQQMPTAIAATGYLGSNNTGIQQPSGHIRLVRISE